jgi:hypothetical protein
MVKYDYVKEYMKGDNMTLFWCSLKSLDPYVFGVIFISKKMVYCCQI